MLFCACLGGSALAASAGASEPVRVRVLLEEGAGSLRIASPALSGGKLETLEAHPDGIHLGRRSLGGQLRLGEPGPHRVGRRRVRGAVTVELHEGRLRAVNEVPIESYVAGMLLGEIYESWGPEVLRAQAVVGRTYALHRRARARGRRPYDLEASTSGQIYLGVDGESAAGLRAVEETRGEVLVFEGEPILAAFHSSSGGRTAAADEVWGRALPYLRSLTVEGEEDSPDTYWRLRVDPATLGRALERVGHALGPIQALRVVERSASGRVRELEVRGRKGSVRIEGRALRRALGATRVRSTLFEVRREGPDFVLVGSGRGHGVGMSQWGARAMALRGRSYRDILAHFYPGATLTRLDTDPTPGAPRRTALEALR